MVLSIDNKTAFGKTCFESWSYF